MILTLSQIITNTILIGSIYTLISLGFFVIYKSLGIINLAQGEFILIGSYLAWIFNHQLAIDPLVALIFVLPLMLIVGYLLAILYLSHDISRNPVFAMLITWALAMILRNGFQLALSSTVRTVDTVFKSPIQIGIVILPSFATIIVIVVAALIVALTLMFQMTRFGRQIRCVSQNIKAAEMLGMNVQRIQMSALLLGMLLIGLAGVLISPIYPLSPVLGQWLTIKCLAVVLLTRERGLGFVWVSGLIVAFFEVIIAIIATGYGTNLSSVVSFAVIIIALVWDRRFQNVLRVNYARFKS